MLNKERKNLSKMGRLTNSKFEKLKNAKKEYRFQNFYKIKGQIISKIVQTLNLLFVMNKVLEDKCEARLSFAKSYFLSNNCVDFYFSFFSCLFMGFLIVMAM